jgi:hypothetical protein
MISTSKLEVRYIVFTDGGRTRDGYGYTVARAPQKITVDVSTAERNPRSVFDRREFQSQPSLLLAQ